MNGIADWVMLALILANLACGYFQAYTAGRNSEARRHERDSRDPSGRCRCCGAS